MRLQTAKEIGNWGEKYAVWYLRLHGYRILERNWRHKKGELDIIASTFRELVFVEVKTRSYEEADIDRLAPPSDAVHYNKRRVTRSTAQAYLNRHPTKKQPRMDVIEIWLKKKPKRLSPKVLRLNHIKAAY